MTLGSLLALEGTGKNGAASQASEGMFRTVQGILSGMGFLGAGVILRGIRQARKKSSASPRLRRFGSRASLASWPDSVSGCLADSRLG